MKEKKMRKIHFFVLLCVLALGWCGYSCSEEDELSNGEGMAGLPADVILSNDGESRAVKLALNGNESWSVEAQAGNEEWCTIIPASGKGSGKFIITALPNSDREARSLNLKVIIGQSSHVLSVSQEDTMAVSSVGPIIVDNQSTTEVLTVEANTMWRVNLSEEDVDWITFTPDHGKGAGQITFTVAANPLSIDRSAEIVITAGSVSRTVSILQQNVLLGQQSDSLALVAFYQAADGKYWSSAWDLEQKMTTWKGVTTETIDGRVRVTALSLSRRNLDGVISPAIGNLSELKTLDLSFNNLKEEIPREIGLLTKLEVLKLSDDKLSGELPSSLKNLASLRELVLANNRFMTFPSDILQLANIKEVHVEGNQISSVVGEITEDSKLEKLYLNDNQLTQLPVGMTHLSSLTHLNAANNEIGSLSPEITDLIKIRVLKLDNNSIAGTFPEGFSKLTALEELYLTGAHFTSGNWDHMEQSEKLRIIEATDCGIGGTLPILGRNGTLHLLTRILLNGNHFSGELTDDISNLTALICLELDNNNLAGTLPQDAFENTSNLPDLERFCVANNKIVGKIPVGMAGKLTGWSAMFNNDGFRLNGNYLTGPVPKEFGKKTFGSDPVKIYNYSVNLYPQRDGVVLMLEQ